MPRSLHEAGFVSACFSCANRGIVKCLGWEREEEKVSRGFGETARGKRTAHSILITALFLAAAPAPGVGAGTTAPKTLEMPATVIAHLDLSTPAGSRMVLQRQGAKRYLYIEQSSKPGYIIVDVTQPEFATFVNRQAPSNSDANQTSTAKVETASQDANVPEAPDAASKTAIRSNPDPAATVKLLDLSDPDHPATLQTLKNVTGILADAGRSVIFLTNDEGLWVLKFHREQVQQAKKPPCDVKPDRSARAQAPMAGDCQ